MSETRILVAFIAIVVGLNACSLALEIVVANNSGMTVTLKLPRGTKSLAQGEQAELLYPSVDADYTLRLESAGCILVYRLPEKPPRPMVAEMPHAPVSLQLESDSRLYFVPPDLSMPVDPEVLRGAQPRLFPLAPVSRDCN